MDLEDLAFAFDGEIGVFARLEEPECRFSNWTMKIEVKDLHVVVGRQARIDD